MEEIKKKVTYGEEGKNRADIVEEQLDGRNLDADYSNMLLRQAGTVHKPIGTTYLGSACIHYYSKELIPSNPTFLVVCQTTGMGKVVENHADVGHKQLKSALMKCYGRQDPKTRN